MFKHKPDKQKVAAELPLLRIDFMVANESPTEGFATWQLSEPDEWGCQLLSVDVNDGVEHIHTSAIVEPRVKGFDGDSRLARCPTPHCERKVKRLYVDTVEHRIGCTTCLRLGDREEFSDRRYRECGRHPEKWVEDRCSQPHRQAATALILLKTLERRGMLD